MKNLVLHTEFEVLCTTCIEVAFRPMLINNYSILRIRPLCRPLQLIVPQGTCPHVQNWMDANEGVELTSHLKTHR